MECFTYEPRLAFTKTTAKSYKVDRTLFIRTRYVHTCGVPRLLL